MDQVRVILGVVWQQRFWVLSVFGTSVAVVCWFFASGDLQSQFSKRLSTISNQISAVQTIGREPFHPNEEVIKGDLNQAVLQSKNVYQVWSDLYEHQHTEVLYWPKDNLSKEFDDHMEGKKFLDPISTDMRTQYWNYIQKRFDGLLEIVDARKLAGGMSGRGRPGGGRSFGGETGMMGGELGGRRLGSGLGLEEEENYLVDWLDQGDLEARLFFKSRPSHTQIWVVQEDLWVYEALLNVIANTNKERGATRPDNTAVREIIAIQVGRPAIATTVPLGQIYLPQSSAAGGMSMGRGEGMEMGMGMESGMGMGMSGGEEMGDEYGMGPGGGGGGGADDSMLLADRYLDSEGKPILGKEDIGTEFRQLPVHMILKMDQRWIPQVLIECANAPLPVEVTWLQINASEANSALGGNNSSMRRSSSREMGRGMQGVPDDKNMVTVELQGVVLIYGEPDKEVLTVPGAEPEENELASTLPAAS